LPRIRIPSHKIKVLLNFLQQSAKAQANGVQFGAKPKLDLVRSGLDDTMRQAYNQIREIFLERDNVPDLRTAAYVLAIEKIAASYIEMGV
jgi:glutamate dehydrogenase/leucine dehydrogenase